MSEDLQALARQIAHELAARDLAAPSAGAGGPPRTQNGGVPAGTHNHPVPAPTTKPPTSAPLGVRFVRQNARMADFIDHTLLKAEATRAEVEKLCDEAKEHRFAAVCVNAAWVRLCAERLRGTDVQVATVVGFPLGATTSASKRSETELAVADGATEIDMVAAVGHIKSGDWSHVADDIAAVVAGAKGRLVKVIIESAALTPVEIIKVCAIAKEMGAHYVKTSTGFHAAGGASAEAVALMRMVVGDALGVKASGGVRDCETALKMIANGATRIGTSSGVSMAKCLGPGPLPVTDLLSLASGHVGSCHTCAAAASAPRDAY
jgi:deoxyribose-phosphate aldolase